MDGPSFYEAVTERHPQQVAALAFITGDTLSPRVKSFLEASERPLSGKADSAQRHPRLGRPGDGEKSALDQKLGVRPRLGLKPGRD